MAKPTCTLLLALYMLFTLCLVAGLPEKVSKLGRPSPERQAARSLQGQAARSLQNSDMKDITQAVEAALIKV